MYYSLKFTILCCSLLGVFAKWRKATINFVMSVFPSLRSHGTNRFSLDGFLQNFTFDFFRKSGRLLDNMEKYYIARQATVGSMVHVHCVLNT